MQTHTICSLVTDTLTEYRVGTIQSDMIQYDAG